MHGRVARDLTALLLLAAAAWLTDGPALQRSFAHDHVLYLAERRGSTSFVDGLSMGVYRPDRQYWQGDDDVFYRPLLFATLAAGAASAESRQARSR